MRVFTDETEEHVRHGKVGTKLLFLITSGGVRHAPPTREKCYSRIGTVLMVTWRPRIVNMMARSTLDRSRLHGAGNGEASRSHLTGQNVR
jgi:hypothetical protein